MVRHRLLSLWFSQGLPPTPSGAPGDLEALALWCQQFSPLTAVDPPDGVLIDITGCAHLFGGEAALVAAIARRLPCVRLGLADTAAAAWGLARYGEAGGEDIAPLPLAALNLAPRTIAKLRQVGVRRIGDLMRLPRAELTAGYGPAPLQKLACALGQAPEALRFISAPPEWREAEHYAEPIFAPRQLQGAIQRLTAKLCARLADAQAGATAMAARFYRVDSERPEISLSFAAPCRDEFQIAKLLIEKLAAHIDPGFGVEAITLEAGTTEMLPPVQQGMAQAAPDYTQPINTLLNRLGGARICRVAPHESHIPEYAVRRIPITLPPVPWAKPRYPRPVRLLPRPDAITAIAPVPDDPPVSFTWRGKTHKIAHATGPERIARDWWCHDHDNARPELEKIRDYYAVEDFFGTRFWLFRAGLHDGVVPARWYLHGFFG
jgi:protein ImuB